MSLEAEGLGAGAEALPSLQQAYETQGGGGHVWGYASSGTSDAFPSIDYDKLDKAFERFFTDDDIVRRIKPTALLAVHKGKIVGERYAPNKGARSQFAGASVGKSVTSALIGIRAGDGALKTSDLAMAPNWSDQERQDRGISLDDLNRMVGGLDGGADTFAQLMEAPDAPAYAGNLTQKYRPGTVWEYMTANFVLLLYSIRNTFPAEEAYLSFPDDRLFQKLNAQTMSLYKDKVGNLLPFVDASAQDYARLGQLYLQDGVWEGERILPQGWVDYTTTPGSTDKGKTYGAGWWVNLWEGENIVPSDTFYAYGWGGQYIVVIPSLDVVIVQLGFYEVDDPITFTKPIWRDLISAFSSSAA